MTEYNSAAAIDLVKRMRNGEESAFTQVMDQWKDRVFNYALCYSNDHYFANEVVQKTFIQVFEKIDQLKEPAKLQAWVYKIASNNCRSEGRSRARLRMSPPEDIPQFVDENTPAKKYEQQERISAVKKLLQRIPPSQRQVIIMKEYEGLKFREIAEILGESENTIKSRMYYGLDAMKKILISENLNNEIYYE